MKIVSPLKELWVNCLQCILAVQIDQDSCSLWGVASRRLKHLQHAILPSQCGKGRIHRSFTQATSHMPVLCNRGGL